MLVLILTHLKFYLEWNSPELLLLLILERADRSHFWAQSQSFPRSDNVGNIAIVTDGVIPPTIPPTILPIIPPTTPPTIPDEKTVIKPIIPDERIVIKPIIPDERICRSAFKSDRTRDNSNIAHSHTRTETSILNPRCRRLSTAPNSTTRRSRWCSGSSFNDRSKYHQPIAAQLCHTPKNHRTIANSQPCFRTNGLLHT